MALAALLFAETAAADVSDASKGPERASSGVQVIDLNIAASTQPVPADAEPLPYSVLLNGQAVGDALLLRLHSGELLAVSEDLDRWHVEHNGAAPYSRDGMAYWVLDRYAGFKASLDRQKQAAQIDFAAEAFTRTQLSLVPEPRAQLQPPGMGGFFNYDVFAERNSIDSNSGDTTDTNVNATVEAGYFTPIGVGTSQWLGLGLNHGERNGSNADGRQFTRLESTWRWDDPDEAKTLELGDSIGHTGLLGRPVRFGGVQWSRNFSTQPDFITLPQPALAGQNALPSVLDVYVDGIRRQTVEAPPGPFVMNNIPVLTGQGEVEVVARDLLGREQVISQSYLNSGLQLAPGLHDFSYEAGFLRNDFGVSSNDYGRFVVAGTHRYGFSDTFTGEARVEAQDGGSETVGIGGILGFEDIGIVSAATAVSSGPDNSHTGAQETVSFDRRVRRGLAFGVRAQFASKDFIQLGNPDRFPAPKRLIATNAAFQVPRFGNIGISFIQQQNRVSSSETEAIVANFTAQLHYASITLLGIDRIQPNREYSISLLVGVPLGREHSVFSNLRYADDGNGASSEQARARVQKNLPNGEGWGYYADASQAVDDGNHSTGADADVQMNAAFGSYELGAGYLDDVKSLRGSVSGGIGAMAGHVFASRKIYSGFGIVESGAQDVPLFVNNQRTASTNAEGYAVLPNLLSYENSQVRVDTDNLPVDDEIGTVETTASPYYRSGVLIQLPVRKTQAAIAAFVLPNGKPIPPGTIVTLQGQDRSFAVGRNGEVYLTGLRPGPNRAEINAAQAICSIAFTVPADAGLQPRLGPFKCDGPSP